MRMGEIVIARRFNGPANSGNGGIVAGRVAEFIDGPAEITLRAPVPLDVKLVVERDHHGVLRLEHEGTLLIEARATAFDLDVPAPPTWQEAERLSAHGGSFADSAFNTCVVCGRGRAAGEALRVWADRLPDRPQSFAAWIPDPRLADEDGFLPLAYLWGALDCPGAVAVLAADDERTVLTGRMAGHAIKRVRGGERCIVLGWMIGEQGRKLYSGTAVFNEAGEICAKAIVTWIVLKNPL